LKNSKEETTSSKRKIRENADAPQKSNATSNALFKTAFVHMGKSLITSSNSLVQRDHLPNISRESTLNTTTLSRATVVRNS